MIKSKKYLIDHFLDPSTFRIIYIINLFASGIVFIDVFAYTFNFLNLIWATLILINLIISKKINHVKYKTIIILFLFSMLFTAILHIGISFIDTYKFNFIFNLAYLLHTFLCFFILYGMYIANSLAEIQNEMFFIFKTILILTTVCTFLGFIIVLFKNEIIIDFPFKGFPKPLRDIAESEYILGIVEKDSGNRFEGIFINPNIMAFYCSVSLIFCHILVLGKKFFKIENKIIFYTVIAIFVLTNFTALILSDSYASFIFLIIYIIFNLFYKIVISNTKNSSCKTYIVKSLLFVSIGVLLILSLFTARSYFQNGASDIISDIAPFSSSDIKIDENESDIKFGRPNHDLSRGSGRRMLLKQAYIIFKNNPIIGVGPANLAYYGKRYFESGLIFPNFHNGYVSILVSYGIIGLALFMVFLVLVIIELSLFLFKNKFNNVYPLLFSSLIAYLVFALFEKTMISENNFMCAFFWLMLGYASAYVFNDSSLMLNKKNKKDTGE